MQDARQVLPTIFIHSDPADRAWAEWIAWQLEDARYSVILPAWDFRSGQNSVLAANDALQAAEHVLLILSLDSVKSLPYDPIWPAAFKDDPTSRQRKLLPIRIQQCDPAGLLGPLIPIDLFSLDETRARTILLTGISHESPRPTTPPIFPGSVQPTISSSPTFPGKLPAIWNVPPYNEYFTDRTEALSKLSTDLKAGAAGFVHTHSINGLSGIGKTQVALAYAHLYYYQYEAVLWLNATEHLTPLEAIASLVSELRLDLARTDKRHVPTAAAAVKQWLQDHANWLLIVDDIEDPGSIKPYLPSIASGRVLLTVRTQIAPQMASALRLANLQPDDGALFLLRRTTLDPNYTLDSAPAAEREHAYAISRMEGHLPLALDQAVTYIEETGQDLSYYRERYRQVGLPLLERRSLTTSLRPEEHPEPVVQTWSYAFEMVQQSNSQAYELLQLCALLLPDAIPEEILLADVTAQSSNSQSPIADPALQMDASLAILRRHSLLTLDTGSRTFSIHLLVQAVLLKRMSNQVKYQWAERVIRAVSCAFLTSELSSLSANAIWQHCQRYFPSIQLCASLIERWDIALSEAAQLLHCLGLRLGVYLQVEQSSPLSPDWQAISELELEYIPCLLTAYARLLTRMRYHNEAAALNSLIVTN